MNRSLLRAPTFVTSNTLCSAVTEQQQGVRTCTPLGDPSRRTSSISISQAACKVKAAARTYRKVRKKNLSLCMYQRRRSAPFFCFLFIFPFAGGSHLVAANITCVYYTSLRGFLHEIDQKEVFIRMVRFPLLWTLDQGSRDGRLD